jgi:GNAT superfamily N-acetyltransferase
MQNVIRTATAADAAALSALILRTIRATNAADYSEDEINFACDSFSPDKVARKIAARDVFVAFSRGALAGTASYGDGRLHSLFVDPDYQGQGLGSLLLAHVERHALARGSVRLELLSSITAKRFYGAAGYVYVEDESSGGGTTHLMRKRL